MLQGLISFTYDCVCCRLGIRKSPSFDTAVKNLPPMSLPTEVPAAPLLQNAEQMDSDHGQVLQNTGFS